MLFSLLENATRPICTLRYHWFKQIEPSCSNIIFWFIESTVAVGDVSVSRQYLLILESQPDFHQNVKKASRFSKDPSASPSGTPRSHFPVGFLRGIRYPKVSVLVGRCLHSSPLSLVSVQCLQLSMATCGCWSRTRPLLHVPWCIVQVHRLSTTVGFASFAN
jgi:hypothetical protein